MKKTITKSLIALSLGIASASAMAAGPMVDVMNQSASAQGVVTVPAVTMAEDGFLVSHESNAMGKPVAPGSVGFVRLKAGDHSNVEVILHRSVKPGEKLFAMLHHDTGKMGVYEFGPGSTNVDMPVTANGKVVIKPFMIKGGM
jgi:hypothetical protein